MRLYLDELKEGQNYWLQQSNGVQIPISVIVENGVKQAEIPGGIVADLNPTYYHVFPLVDVEFSEEKDSYEQLTFDDIMEENTI